MSSVARGLNDSLAGRESDQRDEYPAQLLNDSLSAAQWQAAQAIAGRGMDRVGKSRSRARDTHFASA